MTSKKEVVASSSSSGPAPHRHSNTAVPPSSTSITTGAKQMKLVLQCNWVDRTLWATRQIFGGNSINGFLRSAATVQRIKRQRARQMALTKKTATALNGSDVDAAASNDVAGPNANLAAAMSSIYKYDPKKPFDPLAEEQLKKEIMNPRTIKKVKTELEAGIHFCVTLQKTLLGIIAEIDPSQVQNFPPLLRGISGKEDSAKDVAPPSLFHQQNATQYPGTTRGSPAVAAVVAVATASNSAIGDAPKSSSIIPAIPSAVMPLKPHPFASGRLPRSEEGLNLNASSSGASASSPGNPEGSTLRKHRKKKLPPSTEHRIQVPEVDHAGKRYVTKKEHNFRLCEMYRFRPLKSGDFVAARLTSRDLWILARVLKDYPGCDVPPLDFLQLSVARRDSLFREKVMVKDVEDKEDGCASVSRSLVLPLPRTYSEASEWGKRYKKESRIYAMYPQTTSLYPATVIDNSTYCRGDDDIIVVEFDGEEPDAVSGLVPKYHIPARFVIMIPREFPAAQVSTGSKTSSNKRKSTASSLPTPGTRSKSQPQQHQQANSDEALDGMLDEMDYNQGTLQDFDQLDLDFSRPLPEGEDSDGIPQSPSKDFMLDSNF